MRLIGKLHDGTVFLKKGHGDGEDIFEFKTDEGSDSCLSLSLLPFCICSILCLLV